MTHNGINRCIMCFSATQPSDAEKLRRLTEGFSLLIEEGVAIEIEVRIRSEAAHVPTGRISFYSVLRPWQREIGCKSIRDLAKAIDVNRSTIYSWLSGTPMGQNSFEELLEKAPSDSVRQKLRLFREQTRNEPQKGRAGQ